MKPNFIGIGPARCGTTSVYYYLQQHPQVFMSPVKEPHYFTYQMLKADLERGRAYLIHPIKTWDNYEALFRNAGSARAVGEISPSYFWTRGAPEAIASALPGVRLFCILRNPIDRAYSSFCMYADRGMEKRTFEQVVQEELVQPPLYPLAATNYYVRIGFYARHLRPFLDAFADRLKICFFDDLSASAPLFMQELFHFIGVDAEVSVDTSSRFNTQGVHQVEQRLKSTGARGPLRWLRDRMPKRLYYWLYRHYAASLSAAAALPSMSAEARARLVEAYAPDIEALQSLTGRDLSHWLAA